MQIDSHGMFTPFETTLVIPQVLYRTKPVRFAAPSKLVSTNNIGLNDPSAIVEMIPAGPGLVLVD